jgi:RNA polymerase sigma factor (sigma-70 family)
LDDNTTEQWILAVLRKYEEPLLRYATALCGAALAPDVVQDTLLRLCRQREAEVRDHVAQWLFTVCRNRAIELRRKHHGEAQLEEGIAIPAARLPHATLERQQLLDHALEALQELPARRREVVLLKFSAELSYREIAEVTGLGLSNVGVILHEALKQVRERLREKGVLEDGSRSSGELPQANARTRSAP